MRYELLNITLFYKNLENLKLNKKMFQIYLTETGLNSLREVSNAWFISRNIQ